MSDATHLRHRDGISRAPKIRSSPLGPGNADGQRSIPPGKTLTTSKLTAMLFLTSLLVPLFLFSYRVVTATTLVRIPYIEPNYDQVSALEGLCTESHQLFKMVSDSQHCFYDTDHHILGNLQFSKNMYSRQPYISNGYIGARLSTIGQGFSYDEVNIHADNQTEEVLLNGWPLYNKRYTGAYVAGFFSLQEKLPSTNFPELYANGYDSVISSLPYWLQLDIEYTDEHGTHLFSPLTVTEDEITGYHQNMSIGNGLVSTQLIWRNTLEVKIESFAHKEVLPLSVMSLSLRPLNGSLNVILRDSLSFNTSQRTTLLDYGADSDGIYMVVRPDNVPYSQAAVYSSCEIQRSGILIDDFSIVSEARFDLLEGHVTTIQKYVGVVSTELDEELRGRELEEAKSVVREAKKLGRQELFDEHDKTWTKQFEDTNIIIPSDDFLTLASRASLFHLLSNTNVQSNKLTSALGTGGLSSDSYGGMVFWDTDLWIVPGILPFAPDVAKAVSNYRNYTHSQAISNARQYDYDGAAYPWVSGRFGNCTSAGPCVDYEYHINVDVALSSWLLYLAGEDETYLRYTTWPLLRDAATFLTQFVEYNETLGKYTTHNLTDPDEYANHVDNGAFTNAGIETTLRVAIRVAKHLEEEVPQRWLDVVGNIYIPVSQDGITLEYSHMNASVKIKQADVVMLTFPLEFYADSDRAIDDLLYYSLKQADVGPAMTFPIFTAASRRLFSYGCSSQSYLQKSALPYIRAPFAQFSEQADDNVLTNGGTHPAFPFLTAHGGFLQAVVYGVLGLKYSTRVNDSTQKIERYLKFDPVRPLALPGGVRVNGIHYLHQRLDISLTDTHGVITHKGTEPINIEVNCRNDYAGNYTLKPNDTLTVPVFEPPLNVPGSVTECHMIANLTQGMPAEVALSAVDGNNYTYWQAFDRSPAKLIIDLGERKRLSHGSVIWGHRPAKVFTVWVSDDSLATRNRALKDLDDVKFVKVIDRMKVEVSEPFEERYLREVRLLPNNETEFEIDRKFRTIHTRLVMLEIEGTIDDDDDRSGATVNEFVLFSKDEEIYDDDEDL
ncbi:CYFA0S01e13828g1_1 [Cyberlindnera fabianii]|uniref:alpha,alpha-trehalase n=1 Tax=Cyberlindnera fabianii TaxID=36022 RepID=A0A061AKH1_CYBFA|nr:CYFA0S01e13828g1_1 [Cyberlindnera fabianii]